MNSQPPDNTPSPQGDGLPPGEGPIFIKLPPRIDLVCPECGHVQSEPPLVVSTQCRNCLCHYQVRDGEVVVRPRPEMRLAAPDDPNAEPAPIVPEPKKPTAPPRKPPPPVMPWWKRLLLRPDPPREVRCFACFHDFKVGAVAESTQCPSCGGYVSLRHYEIREAWSRNLQTRGDVVLHKEGSIHRAQIECHNLTANGKIIGRIDCSGTFAIHHSDKISGTVTCRRLHVARKVRVEFLEPVTADSMLIEGEVRGVFHCNGVVTLGKRASLFGYVRTAELQKRSGARHVGTLDIHPPAAPGG